jgi:hypothetical protein
MIQFVNTVRYAVSSSHYTGLDTKGLGPAMSLQTVHMRPFPSPRRAGAHRPPGARSMRFPLRGTIAAFGLDSQ